MTEVADTGKVRLAAYVLTLNEEFHIADTVASLRQVTDHILVVDSESTDGTVEAARHAGAQVHARSFDSFERQRNFAIDCVVERFDPEWILTLDADERLSSGLVQNIATAILKSASSDEIDAYMVPLKIRFEGRILRHSGVSRSRLLRVYRPSAGRYESRSVNEHFSITPGKRLGAFRSPIEHQDVTSWERHIAKHNRYSTLEATERATATLSHNGMVTAGQAFRAPYLRRRWLREQVWNRLPAKPLLRFVQMYILSGGFLDGRPGFDISLLQAWQELCTERKFREIVSQSSYVVSEGE